MSFQHSGASAGVFAPYRPPTVIDSSESGGETLWWYNHDHDCMVMEEVHWPAAAVPYHYQLIGAARQPLLAGSVFSIVAQPQLDAIKEWARWSGKEDQGQNWGQVRGRCGEPGRNRTFNPQIKSPLPHSKTLEILMIFRERCAKRVIATQIDATPAQPNFMTRAGRRTHSSGIPPLLVATS